MAFTVHPSPERREAIRRASCAVVRLAAVPQAKAAAHRQSVIVNDLTAYTDIQAWHAVATLEGMLPPRR